MIVVHAGNRVDAGGASARFPERQVEDVEKRLSTFLGEVRPRLVVSAAAAGADLLLLEAALAHGIAAHVVLPFPRAEFRARSVADRGESWLARYDRVVAAVASRPGCTLVEHAESADEAGYRAGNRLLIEHTRGVAEADGILAVAVRPHPGAGKPSITDDFVDQARESGLVALDIDPGVRLVDRPRAFVVMPFGEKDIGGRKVNCDVTFQRLIVPLLEDADLAWDRADRAVDSGIIHVGMIEQLANADIVVVDTIGANPNVYYELGMRHAFADKVTVLLGPEGSAPPFDTRPIRHFSYQLPGTQLEDDAALDAIRKLQPVFAPGRLRDAEQDSPVFYFFKHEPKRLQLRDGQQPQRLLDLHHEVKQAIDRCDLAVLARLADRVRAEPLHRDDQRRLLLLLGMGLRECGHYEQGITVLGPLAYKPSEGQYRLWAQQLALALRRRGERSEEAWADPESDWREAQQLLEEVRGLGDDPETCGIAGGLAKQRARRALEQSQRPLARALLESAAGLYLRGAEAAPTDYYTTLNAATTLRVIAQRLGGPSDQLDHAGRILPVVRYFAERAAAADPYDFWALATVAECVLTAHLLEDGENARDVVAAYARAVALQPGADARRSVRNQLRFYELAGDPVDLLQPLHDLLPAEK